MDIHLEYPSETLYPHVEHPLELFFHTSLDCRIRYPRRILISPMGVHLGVPRFKRTSNVDICVWVDTPSILDASLHLGILCGRVTGGHTGGRPTQSFHLVLFLYYIFFLRCLPLFL